jgi:hypothetical protein
MLIIIGWYMGNILKYMILDTVNKVSVNTVLLSMK